MGGRGVSSSVDAGCLKEPLIHRAERCPQRGLRSDSRREGVAAGFQCPAVFPLRRGVQKQILFAHLKTTTATTPESSGNYLPPEKQGKATIFDYTKELRGPLFFHLPIVIQLSVQSAHARSCFQANTSLYSTTKSLQCRLKAAALVSVLESKTSPIKQRDLHSRR